MAKRILYAAALVVLAIAVETTFFWRTPTCDSTGCGMQSVLGLAGLTAGGMVAYLLALAGWYAGLGERRRAPERPWDDVSPGDRPATRSRRSSPGLR